ncbi:MAG: type II secretion system minor pseudopilin GspJ [Endozoicomonas sp.]
MKLKAGFTLLELMIAILLFAMISTAAYKLFDSVSRAQQVTDGIFDSLDEIQRTQVILEKDLLQVAPRPVRDELGDRRTALQAPGRDGHIIEFTRSGWRNPLGEIRSNLQRVAYDLEEGELVRYYWQMLDRAPDPVLIRQKLLDNVQKVSMRFMDEKKRWLTSWPPQAQGQDGKKSEQPVMPHAVEMVVQHRDFGVMTAMLPLMDYKPEDPQKQAAKEQGEKGKQRPSGKESSDPDLDGGDE